MCVNRLRKIRVTCVRVCVPRIRFYIHEGNDQQQFLLAFSVRTPAHRLWVRTYRSQGHTCLARVQMLLSESII